MNNDPYTILGVPRTATQDEIKKAYRKLAHQFHPDKNKGDDVKFKEVNEAYQILSDPKKRANFDNFGFAYNDGGFKGGSNPENFWDFFGSGRSRGNTGFEDFFSSFSDVFGQYSQSDDFSQSTFKGEDINLEISVSKKDLGSIRNFQFNAFDTCDKCHGLGLEEGSKMIDCDECKGHGQVRQSVRTAFGVFTQVKTCSTCKGKRRIPELSCRKCSGEGRIKAKRKFEVHLPSDIDNNYSVIVPKGGNAGKEGNQSGDLLIIIKVK